MTTLFRAVRHNGKAAAGLLILLFFVVLAVVPDLIAPGDPARITDNVSEGVSGTHPLGTTAFGQDILVQVVHGARPALLIAVVTGLLATALSVLIGVSAAYLGGI